MFNGSKIKKFTAILAIVMVASFALAAVIFVGEYGKNGFTALEDSIRPENAVDVNEEKTEALTGIKNIKVSTPSDDISIIPSDTNEVKAHLHGYYKSSSKDYKPEFTVASAGDELTIKVTYKLNVIASTMSNLELDIYLPRSYSENLQINTASAEVNTGELNLNSFVCTTASGDLKAGRVNSKRAELKTASGNTKISGKYESFTFNSASGDFSTEGITAVEAGLGTASGRIEGNISADVLQLHSASGDLLLDQVNAKKSTVETASGRIRLKGMPGNIEATSTSGDIRLEYGEFNHNIKIGTASGRTEIKLPQNPEFALSFKTASGTGKCDFPVTITGTQKRNNIEGIVTSDRNSITVTSTSGDLAITR